MQKLILDTNVIVSELISNAIPTKIFAIAEFEYTRIVTPREYWDSNRP